MTTIAIIDDDIYIGNMLEELLQANGYQVLRAYSGTEALYLLERTQPDLVLLDLMLPGLSGEAVLPHIQDIPVIVLSAKVDVQEGQKVSAMEIWHRFPKFVLGFLTASIVMSVVSSSLGADVGKMLVDNGINKISVPLRGWFFALAFVSIGLTTNFRELGKYFKGGKPILLGFCCWVGIACVSLGAQKLLGLW